MPPSVLSPKLVEQSSSRMCTPSRKENANAPTPPTDPGARVECGRTRDARELGASSDDRASDGLARASDPVRCGENEQRGGARAARDQANRGEVAEPLRDEAAGRIAR